MIRSKNLKLKTEAQEVGWGIGAPKISSTIEKLFELCLEAQKSAGLSDNDPTLLVNMALLWLKL